MNDSNWSRLISQMGVNIRSLSDGINRLPLGQQFKQTYPEYLNDIGALCACVRIFQDTLTPASHHLAIFPYEKIYKDPIAIPNLLTTATSNGMRDEIELLKTEEYTENIDMSVKNLVKRINDFNNILISISQVISDMNIT
ncbi:hypothetical protein cand_018210 [Cryptosporidium andersoni]|uniref:Uncharacterized protein n=1 Tax=Cryptosporidium andersoni TaxID=117008 RepID=A0A1J4MH03_9CRYT|nr:hypothetical protein cand_018210 [Cryptosporidium andersoni]